MARIRKANKELVWRVTAKILFSVLVVVIVKSFLVVREYKKFMQKFQFTIESCAKACLDVPLTEKELKRIEEKSR